METVAPPAVLYLVRVEGTETVRKASRQQLGHLGPLLVGKAGAHPVGLGVLDIHFGMSHIQVAAEDDRLFCVQPQQVGPEIVFPLHPVIQPLEAVLAVGGVAVDKIELRIFQRQHPALVVMLVDANARRHGQRLGPAPAGRAAVALFLRRVSIFCVAFRRKIRLARLHLGLLYREDVGVQRGKACGEIVGQAGPQAIDVPADEFHVRCSNL